MLLGPASQHPETNGDQDERPPSIPAEPPEVPEVAQEQDQTGREHDEAPRQPARIPTEFHRLSAPTAALLARCPGARPSRGCAYGRPLRYPRNQSSVCRIAPGWGGGCL